MPGTGSAPGGVGNVLFRRAEPGRPDDVPGLAVLPSGVCGRPAAATIFSFSQVGTAGFELHSLWYTAAFGEWW